MVSHSSADNLSNDEVHSSAGEERLPTETGLGRRASGETSSFRPAESSNSPTTPSASASPAPPPAELLKHPRYRLLELLGAGGMGTVYKARHRLMHRDVALKVIRGELVDRPEMVGRFEREVRAAAHLSHPNIVTAYDAEAFGALHFLVMEYIAGENLGERIGRHGALPVSLACEFARQTALGLQHAFSRGMVHRDVKPHNLIVTTAPAAVVKILDFGLARFIQETYPAGGESAAREPSSGSRGSDGETSDQTLVGTNPGALMGTSNYIAPEQANDPRSADIRADIYSLGCTLYHMLTGSPPFGHLRERERLDAHRYRLPQPVSAVHPGVSPALSQVVERMLAKDPARRYQTPAEVADALAPFATPATETPAALSTAKTPLQFFCGRRRTCTLAIGLLVGLLFGAAGVAFYRHYRPSVHPPDAPARPANESRFVTAELQRFVGHTGQVSSVSYARHGQLLLSGSFDRTLRTWDARTGRPLHVFRGHTGRVRGVALSADGRLALSGSEDRTARVWDTASGRELRRLDGHTRTVTSVAFSPDGKRVLSGSEDNSIRLWEVATGKTIRQFPCAAESVAFAPDGRRVASGGWDKVIHVWDVASGRERRALNGHKGGIKSVVFSADGRRILSGSEDRTVVLWDVARGRAVRRWQAHKGFIWGVAFSPGGGRILSTGWDRTARVWDVATGQALQLFAPDAEEILCGAIAPDGRHAVCGCADGLIRLWTIPAALKKN